MNKLLKNLSLIFAAGCFGGLAKGITAWLFGAAGITGMLGVKLTPALTPAMIYQHMVWGGIWAFLFLLPVKKLSYSTRGIFYSSPQSLVALLILFPKMDRGFLGLALGYLTPCLILFYGVVWGIVTGLWLKLAKES
jgi:hypothetical protein